MIRSIKITFIVIMTLLSLLFCFPCFASNSKLRVVNTDHFTINLPAQMRQLGSRELPYPENKDKLTYAFMESNKEKNKSILLIISLEKIDNPVPNDPIKEMAKILQDNADDPKCPGRTTRLAETRISGQKAYYFERRSENCVVTLERYWATINGNHAILIYLARPGKSDDAVSESVVKEIPKIKLK